MNAELVQMLVLIFGPTGGAFVGTKMAFNGIYKRLDRHELKIDELMSGQARNRERLATVETKVGEL